MFAHCLRLSQNARRSRLIGSINKLACCLALLCLAGCQEQKPPATPLEAMQRAADERAKQGSKSADVKKTAESPKAIKEPEAVPPQAPPKAEPLPQGTVVADVAKDFAPTQNGHPD